MLQQLFSIARNTFLESIRQTVYLVLILATMVVLILLLNLSAYTLEDDNKQFLELGLSTLSFMGVFLAAFAATGVLTSEIENRTALTVISKPVARPVFVAGKFLGVAATITLAFWILGLCFLLLVRHQVLQAASDPLDWPVILFWALSVLISLAAATLGNYLYRWSFKSTFIVLLAGLLTLSAALVLVINKNWQFQAPLTEFGPDATMAGGQILWALLLVYEGVLLVTAIAVAFSTRLNQVMTIATTFGVAVLATMSERWYTGYLTKAQAAVAAGDVPGLWGRLQDGAVAAVYRLFPNLQLYWQGDALTRGVAIPAHQVLLLSLYSACFIAAMLALAIALFQEREVG